MTGDRSRDELKDAISALALFECNDLKRCLVNRLISMQARRIPDAELAVAEELGRFLIEKIDNHTEMRPAVCEGCWYRLLHSDEL